MVEFLYQVQGNIRKYSTPRKFVNFTGVLYTCSRKSLFWASGLISNKHIHRETDENNLIFVEIPGHRGNRTYWWIHQKFGRTCNLSELWTGVGVRKTRLTRPYSGPYPLGIFLLRLSVGLNSSYEIYGILESCTNHLTQLTIQLGHSKPFVTDCKMSVTPIRPQFESLFTIPYLHGFIWRTFKWYLRPGKTKCRFPYPVSRS